MSEALRTQDNRTLAIGTSLGKDKLLILGMHGSESLGRLFHFELDLVSEGSFVAAKDILGKNITIRLIKIDGSTRYFNGFIIKFDFLGVQDKEKDKRKIFSYRAALVPWTWFLTRTADCRIFQDMKVPDIIEKIFRDRGFTDFKTDFSGSYRKWDYCVQYRETDFNFISRLMENEGIYYYFSHEDGKHTLVMCDSPNAHKAAEKYDSLHFDQPDLSSKNDAYIWDWSIGQEITPNKYAITDYDPLQPRAALQNAINVSHDHDPDTFEVFDYPGGFVAPGDGKTYANIRMEEAEAQYIVAHGTSSARGIFAGAIFKLEDHPACDAEDYLITAVSYQIRNDDMGLGISDDGGSYRCQLSCIPKTYEYRTPRITPKPIVQGPQTAVVMVPDGQEIYTDKYGRVKIKFHWDRSDAMNETVSCWVRVSQPWAGKKWGAISIPRKGQEVIVDFLEGDPDRPIITGRVYNGDNLPPYELPTHATMTTFKTNSSKGGGGFNEFRFEDKKDSEQIFINAQKNMDIRVKNDRLETIEHDRHLTVQNDMLVLVNNDKHQEIDANYYESCGADHHETISGKEAKSIAGTMSLDVTGDVAEQFGGNHSEITSDQLYLKATDIIIEGTSSITIKVAGTSIAIGSGGMTVTVDGDLETTSSGKTSMTAGSDFSIEAGSTFSADSGTSFSIEAGSSLSISASAAGKVSAGAALQVTASGPMTLQGAVIKIN